MIIYTGDRGYFDSHWILNLNAYWTKSSWSIKVKVIEICLQNEHVSVMKYHFLLCHTDEFSCMHMLFALINILLRSQRLSKSWILEGCLVTQETGFCLLRWLSERLSLNFFFFFLTHQIYVQDFTSISIQVIYTDHVHVYTFVCCHCNQITPLLG